MKLITEFNTPELEFFAESTDEGKKHFIEGVFMQAEALNRNKRIYRKPILERAVHEYNESQVKTGRAVGELNHPDGPTVNLDKVSHRITRLEWQGNDVIGKALVLNTPQGRIVKGLLEGGVQLGVSSRGMGSLVTENGTDYVGDDFTLATVDIVQDPSAHDAYVNGIMENVDWVQTKSGWIKRDRGIKSEKEIQEAKIGDMKKLLSRLIKT